METSLIFRIIFALAFVLTFGISGTYRRRADRQSDEEISREEEGALLLAVLRLGGLTFMAASLIYIVRPAWLAWASLPLPDAARWVAAGFSLLVAPPFAYWIFSNLGTNVTPTVTTRREAMLVTRGPYRWVRHPLYTFGFLFWLSQGVLAANGLLVGLAIGAIIAISIRTPKEEARLLERFGDAYRDYVRRTGRYFPRLLA